MKDQPTISRKEFLYNLRRSSYEKEWGTVYERRGLGVRILTFLFRFIPKVGPFRGIGFKVPTPQTEKMFEDSFDASIKYDQRSFAQMKAGTLKMPNRDLDTGQRVSPGEYLLTDRTYDKLLVKLSQKKFAGVTPAVREDILHFYSQMTHPDQHGIEPELVALKAFSPPGK